MEPLNEQEMDKVRGGNPLALRLLIGLAGAALDAYNATMNYVNDPSNFPPPSAPPPPPPPDGWEGS